MANRQLLLNAADSSSCVDDFLAGFVANHPGLVVLPKHRVVMRRDFRGDGTKVALVAGGGSGHEPAHAGFVGRGMLTAAVPGPIFTSPPPNSIYTAVKAIAATGSPSGVLLMAKNYTGDRLNFGIAMQRSLASGIHTDFVDVAEDAAVLPPGPAGKRGLAGAALAFKVAGAMAEEGRSMPEIVQTVKEMSGRMATMSVALGPLGPSVPGSGSVHENELKAGEAELGRGIHGETGTGRTVIHTTAAAVASVLARIREAGVPLQSSGNTVVLVNNLGGLAVVEIGIVVAEVQKQLQSLGISPTRIYSGTLVTSLAVPGFSVTILNADETLVNYLDAPTDAPAWPKTVLKATDDDKSFDEKVSSIDSSKSTYDGTEPTEQLLTADTTAILKKALNYATQALINCERQLNDLDTGGGDGDCGSTIRRGAEGIMQWLNSETADKHLSSPKSVLWHLGSIAEDHMGGSSGALYALLFTAGMKAIAENPQVSGARMWLLALESGIQAIMQHGRARPGNRTMLDALHPAFKTFEENLDLPIAQLASAVASAAETGAKATANMQAGAGRASYTDPTLVSGVDPGAHAVGIWMRALCEAVKLMSFS